ncbi:2-acylglycerol O-acyltransferase 1-like [Glandiceps talaboti]
MQVLNMTRILGIDFAPFVIPLQRRLQTLACLKYVFSFVIMSSMTTAFTLYLLFSSYYWLALLYLLWLAIDWKTPSRGGRRAEWFRHWVMWKYFADYFPATLHKTCDLDPNFNYVLAFHPHGILATGSYIHFGTEGSGFSKIFPGIKAYLLIMKIMVNLPIVHDYYMLPGCCDVSKESIHYLLEENGKGNACVIVVGGAKEALEAKPGKCTVLLKNRKGFCKVALKHGAHLVPIYSFGEENLFSQVPNPEGSIVRKIQNVWQRTVGFSLPFFHGRGIFNYNFGLLPHRSPIDTIVGTPIPVQKTPNPTNEEVESLHQLYMQELTNLFNEHKHKYGDYGNKEIHFI